jgi:hypothetical protein
MKYLTYILPPKVSVLVLAQFEHYVILNGIKQWREIPYICFRCLENLVLFCYCVCSVL